MNKLLEQILRMDRDQLNDVIRYVNERRSQIRTSKRLSFSINDEVWIDHKMHGKSRIFIVDKINTKTISVRAKEGFGVYRVSPSMLNKI